MCRGNPGMSQTHSHILLQKSQSISLREEEEARQNALETWSSATFKLNISAYLFTPERQLLLNIQTLMEQAFREDSQAKNPCPELAFLLDCSLSSFVQYSSACFILLIMYKDHPDILLIHLDLYNRLPQP